MLRDLHNMLTFLLFLGFLILNFPFIIWFCFNLLTCYVFMSTYLVGYAYRATCSNVPFHNHGQVLFDAFSHVEYLLHVF